MPGAVIETKRNDLPKILERLQRLGASQVLVGLPEKVGKVKHKDSKLSIAEIGAIHEFGTETIPQRSFIRQGMTKHRTDIEAHLKSIFLTIVHDLQAGLEQKLNQLGAVTMGYVHEQFRQSGVPSWAPLSPRTIAERRSRVDESARGGEKPLWDTGQLVQSLTWEVNVGRSVSVQRIGESEGKIAWNGV